MIYNISINTTTRGMINIMTDNNVEQHWTENFIVETDMPDGSTEFILFNESNEEIGRRVNKLMAQVALLDYAAANIDTYIENPTNYLISLKKLINSYDSRYGAIISTGEVMTNDNA